MIPWGWDQKFSQEELQSHWKREDEDGFFKIKFTFIISITNNANPRRMKISTKSMKKTTLLAIRELQPKAIIRYYHTPDRITKIKAVTTPNTGKDMETLNLSHISGGM